MSMIFFSRPLDIYLNYEFGFWWEWTWLQVFGGFGFGGFELDKILLLVFK